MSRYSATQDELVNMKLRRLIREEVSAMVADGVLIARCQSRCEYSRYKGKQCVAPEGHALYVQPSDEDISDNRHWASGHYYEGK